MSGEKEAPGLWIAQTEGTKFWLQVITELKNRGVQDIFIACVDGLKGLALGLRLRIVVSVNGIACNAPIRLHPVTHTVTHTETENQ